MAMTLEEMKRKLKRSMPSNIPLTDELRAQGFRRDKTGMTAEERASETLKEEERFKLWPIMEWAEMPPKPPLIEGMWEFGRNALLYGPPGLFKSFVVMDIAVRLALGDTTTGLPVHRTDDPPTVAYIAGEGAFGWRPRVEAMAADVQQALRERPVMLGVEPWVMDPGDNPADPDPQYLEGLNRLAAERVDVLVLDTLQTMKGPHGGDTNHAKTIAGLYEYPQAVQREIRRLEDEAHGAGRSAHVVTALWIHHSNKDGRFYRGSGALTADADQVWRLTGKQTTPDGWKVILQAEKTRDAEPVNWEAHLRLVKRDDGTVVSLRVTEWRKASADASAATPKVEYDKTSMWELFEEWAEAKPDEAKAAAQRGGRGIGGQRTVGKELVAYAAEARGERAVLPKGHHRTLAAWLAGIGDDSE